MAPAGYQVSGSVTLAGQPAPGGTIRFEPHNTGPTATAEIRDGKFTTLPESGIYGGSHRVQIELLDGSGKALLPRAYEEVVDFPAADSTRDFAINK